MQLLQVHALGFFNNLFGPEGIVLLVIGLLIFGRRLPEVGKNLGQTIVEFKKGLNGKGVEQDAPEANREEPVTRVQEKRRVSATAPAAKSLPSTEEV